MVEGWDWLGGGSSPKNARHVVSKWRDADNKIETTIILAPFDNFGSNYFSSSVFVENSAVVNNGCALANCLSIGPARANSTFGWIDRGVRGSKLTL